MAQGAIPTREKEGKGQSGFPPRDPRDVLQQGPGPKSRTVTVPYRQAGTSGHACPCSQAMKVPRAVREHDRQLPPTLRNPPMRGRVRLCASLARLTVVGVGADLQLGGCGSFSIRFQAVSSDHAFRIIRVSPSASKAEGRAGDTVPPLRG